MQRQLDFKNPWPARYAAALVAVGAGFLVRLALAAWVGPGLPTYITFYPFVMAVALLGGFGPGLLATAATALVVDYWVLPPQGFGVASLVDAVGLAFFSGMGVFMSVVAELFRRARPKAAAYDKELALRESQAELRRSEERFRSLVEQAVDGIFVSDAQGHYLDVNSAGCQMLGYSRQEMLRLSIADVIAADEVPRIGPEVARFAGGSVVRSEWRFRRKDGSLFPGEVVGRQLAEGRLQAILRDISERKQAEEVMRDLNAKLEARVAEQTAEIRQANERLEQRVAERTAELSSANDSLQDSRLAALNLMDDALRARQQAEAASAELRSASEQRRLALEAADLGAWDYHFNTGDVFWDGRCRNQWGIPQGSQITYAAAVGAIHPEDRRAVDEAVKQALAGADGGAYHRQFRVVWPDGSEHWIASHGRVYFESEGEQRRAVRFIGINREITREKQAEEQLQRTNQELEQRVTERTAELRASSRYARSLLEASLDPLVTISQAGKITDVNRATESVTGVAREALIGSDFSAYFTEPGSAQAGYQKVLADGEVRDYPLTIRAAAGHTTDVLYNATVYRNEAGEVQGVFAAARDVTERKQAERRREMTNALLALFAQKTSAQEYLAAVVEILQRWSDCQALGIRVMNENRELPYVACAGFDPEFLQLENTLSLTTDVCVCLRVIADAAELQERALLTPAGSFRCDNSAEFVGGLPAKQQARYRGTCVKFGFASLAVIPVHYRDLVLGLIHLADRRPGWFPPAAVEFIESMAPLIGEAVHRFQTEAELARHRDHLEELVKQRTGELVASNIRLEREIAERKLAQEKLQHTAADLERSNCDLEQFAYVASHDLQEPLRAVGGYVKLLQRRFPETVDAKARDYIAGAADGAARMGRLITDLLAYSRVGTQGARFVPNDLNALLKEVLHNLQTSINDGRATVTSEPLPTLAVDATQTRQLFQNLIANALKFRAEGPPQIHVAAQQQEGRWVVSVRDNGIGIEPQFFDRIFHIFQRLHTRKHYPGTGIGLAICKRIVERRGGAIWVESQPGQGSTFYFSIPEISDISKPAV